MNKIMQQEHLDKVFETIMYYKAENILLKYNYKDINLFLISKINFIIFQF